MKIWQKRLLFFGGFLLLLFLFRGTLFRLLFAYEPQVMISDSGTWGSDEKSQYPEMIFEAQAETASILSYDGCSGDNLLPNLIAERKTAHCVGYAALMAARLRKMDQVPSPGKILHMRGQLYFLGWNLHNWQGCPAWMKDHDFVLVKPPSEHEFRAFDPALFDYFRIREVRLRPKSM